MLHRYILKALRRKETIYATIATIVSLAYLLIVFVLEWITRHFFGYSSLAISIATAFILGILFVPLRNRVQHFIDTYFFKGTSEEIAQQNEQLMVHIAQAEKYKTLSTLAGGIAHEIKNPLTAINTFSEYLPLKMNDATFVDTFSRIVPKEVSRINDLVHQLLDYAKPSPLSLTRVHIHTLLAESIELFTNTYFSHHITVKCHFFAPPETTLSLDQNQLRQAFINIILNAIEAMPDGGTLSISTNAAANSLHIAFADTGDGILPEDLPRLFEPFFSRKEKGTGLGLAITYSIVEQHHGKVWANSTHGKGTTIHITLPITEKLQTGTSPVFLD